jgi:hypothetical protein
MIGGIESKKINIKELTLPEPGAKVERPFDPRHDISENVWIDILNYLDERDKKNDPLRLSTDFFIAAARVRLLAPERLPGHILRSDYRQVAITVGDNKWSQDTSYGFTDFAGYARILYPDISPLLITPERKASLHEMVLNEISEAVVREDMGIAYSSAAELVSLRMADPDIVIVHEDLEQLGELTKKYTKELLHSLNRPGIIEDFVKIASLLRVLFPDKMNEIKITPSEWELMRRRMDEDMRRVGIWPYLSFATDLAFLTADDINIDNQGARLVYKDQKGNFHESQQVPERRRF